MDTYYLKNKYLYIYGAGTAGADLLNLLIKNNIHFRGFIDKRENLKEFRNYAVYNLTEIDEKIQNKKECAIIISVRNVFEHNSIVIKLKSYGFYNIIYKPYEILQGMEEKSLLGINRAYEELFTRKSIPVEPIAEANTVSLLYLKDMAFIKMDEKYIIANLPYDILFTNQNGTAWGNQNFCEYISVKLYQEIYGNTDIMISTIEEYVSDFSEKIALSYGMKTDDAWRNNVIQGRLDIYQEMKNNLEHQYDFFIQNCPAVKERAGGGYQLISSGKNRVSFLAGIGKEYIPVKMNKELYDKFINMQAVNKLQIFLETGFEIFAPIRHPFFYSVKAQAHDYSKAWVRKIVTLLYIYVKTEKINRYDVTIVDYLHDGGYLSRLLAYIGYKVSRVESDDLTILSDELFHFQPEVNNKWNGCCDVSICDYQNCDINTIASKTKEKVFLLSNYDNMDQAISIMDRHGFCLKNNMFVSWWKQRFVTGLYFSRVKQNDE